MNEVISIQTKNMGRALGTAISKHVDVLRREESGRKTAQASKMASVAFRRFEEERDRLVKTLLMSQAL